MKYIQRTHGRVAVAVAAAAAIALVTAGCGGSDTSEDSSKGGTTSGGAGIKAAQAQVDKFTANPPLEVSPLPSRPKTSTYAILLNCTTPACTPGAMDPAMKALGWKFEELPYDLAKGPSALGAALTQAIAKHPDVIFLPGNYPLTTYQSQVDDAVKQGIKFVATAESKLLPGYIACIQCGPALESLGALTADIALADAGSKTDIAVAYDKTIGGLVTLADGVKQQVAKNGDGSRVLDLEQSVSATPAANAAKTTSFLQRNPNVKYIVVTLPQFMAATALNSAGLGSRVKYVGMFAYSEPEVASVKDGQVLAYAAGELASFNWRAADVAARAMMGVDIEVKEPVPPMRVINQSNADISLLDPADYQNIYKKAWQVQ